MNNAVEEIAQLTKNNLENFKKNEIIDLYIKTLTLETIHNNLLYNELIHLTDRIDYKKDDSLEKMSKIILSVFERYPPKIANSLLEDDEFTEHNAKSIRYSYLKDNEIIFENSIKKAHKEDRNTVDYLDNLLKYFKRNIDTDLISVRLKMIDWSDKISWVVFKFTKK
jgi:hypothetical protein